MVLRKEQELVSQKSRLFTFGCSFTQYFWPTWADILGREFQHFENWGKLGGGNQFIFNSLIECMLRNQLDTDDMVVIMWTNVTREDRYIKDAWATHGNVFTTQFYSPEFLHRYFDIKGCLIRDMAVIAAAKKLLELSNIPHIFLSMVPITNIDQYTVKSLDNVDDILSLHKDTISCIRPSIFEKVFDFDWSRNKNPKGDLHPTPLEHLEYLDKILPELPISKKTRKWVSKNNHEQNFITHSPLRL
jgi:hypothetical protein